VENYPSKSALEYNDISFGLLDILEDIQLSLCFRVVLLAVVPALACYGLTLPVMFDYVKRQDLKGLLKATGSIFNSILKSFIAKIKGNNKLVLLIYGLLVLYISL
jgi:hypothetical protein